MGTAGNLGVILKRTEGNPGTKRGGKPRVFPKSRHVQQTSTAPVHSGCWCEGGTWQNPMQRDEKCMVTIDCIDIV